MNILIDGLPESVEIDGKEYMIHTDFRNWIQFEILFSDGGSIDEAKFMKMLELCYIDLPPSLGSAIYVLVLFRRRKGRKEKRSRERKETSDL